MARCCPFGAHYFTINCPHFVSNWEFLDDFLKLCSGGREVVVYVYFVSFLSQNLFSHYFSPFAPRDEAQMKGRVPLLCLPSRCHADDVNKTREGREQGDPEEKPVSYAHEGDPEE